MDIFDITIVILAISTASYFFAVKKITKISHTNNIRPDSLLSYYGKTAAIWAFVPAFSLLLFYSFLSPIFSEMVFIEKLSKIFPEHTESQLNLAFAQLQNVANGTLENPDININRLALELKSWDETSLAVRSWVVLMLLVITALFSYSRLTPKFKARKKVESFLQKLFLGAAVVAILITIAIVASLLFEALRFFEVYNIFEFLFGTHWSPNIAIRDDQVGSSGSFGMLPVLSGTLLIALIAMIVALPIGIFSAIYMTEFAPKGVRDFIKPTLEILAGIPTVVYGFFAALMAAPFFRSIGLSLGMDVSSESALAAGAVMGIMIIPFISSLSDDVINSVPQSLKDGSIGLGATKAETVINVVLPAALPGLVGAFLLAVSRAIGETMIVVMAAGHAANLTANPLEAVTTVTVQIVSLLTGDTVFDSPKTLSAFALGITLFVVTLLLNIGALTVSRKLSEKYD